MKIDRAALLSQLEKVKPALRSGGQILQLSHLWFDGKNVLAYDGGLGIIVKHATELSGGVPGAVMLGMLQSTTLKELEIVSKESSLEIQMGRSRVKLAVLDVDARVWPFPDKIDGAELKLTDDILEALRRAMMLKPSNPLRTEEHGITLFPAKKDLALYGGGGLGIVEIVVSATLPAEMEKIVLPYAFVEQIVRQCSAGDVLRVSDDCLAATAEGLTIFSNVLDKAEVSDIPTILGRFVTGKEALVDVPVGLDALLDRVSLLSGKDEGYVELATKGREMRVSGVYALGDLEEVFLLNKAADAGSHKLLADVLKTALKETSSLAMGADTVILFGEKDCMVVLGTMPVDENKSKPQPTNEDAAQEKKPAGKAKRKNSPAVDTKSSKAPKRRR